MLVLGLALTLLQVSSHVNADRAWLLKTKLHAGVAE